MNGSARFLFLIAIAFLNIHVLIAQDRDNYNLLWEIKHKDSAKKSYLFGTLHVKDNRAFKFSDSVIPAIKNSEIFALEINPDSINDDFDKNLYLKSPKNIFKKVLSKEDYQRLKDRFFEINKIDLDSFPILHPKLIESMLTKEKDKPNDRRTFLDAYLYGIAHNSNKKITGLEKIEDQIPLTENLKDEDVKKSILGILNNSKEELDEQLETITQLYYEGNIDKILYCINKNAAADKIMVRRNNVMVNSMVKIMQNNTIFAAVGAAHLPGNDGMLELLAQKGYSVRKVQATFNQENEQYKIVPNTTRWFLTNDESLGYSVLTPTKPIALDIVEKYESYSSTDLIFGSTFDYLIMDLRKQNLKKGYDFVGNIINSHLKDSADSVVSKRTYQKDSIQFTEAIIQKEKSVARMQLAFYNKIVYVFFSESTLDEITSPYADTFFNSIKVFDPKIKPSVWRTKIDTVGAYSVRIPKPETDRTQVKENPYDEEKSSYILNMFTTEDEANKTVYILRYNDQPLGYYLKQQNDYYVEFDNYFSEKGHTLSESKKITLGAAEGEEYEVLFSNKFHTKAKLFLRGNRTYLLMAQKTVENEKISDDDEFLNSFKLLPYAKTTFDTVVTINEKYSFKAPSKEVLLEEERYDASMEYSSLKNYSSIDRNTAGTYLVQSVKLKPYYRKKSPKAFYEDYIKILTEYNDTVISNVSTTLAGKPAREIRMTNPDTKVKQRMKLLLEDDTIILLLTYLGDEEIDKPRVNDFFDSFEIKKNTNKFDLTASKAALIFKNLKSKDSTKFNDANGAFEYYAFDASEYSTIAKNLTHNFKNDSLYHGPKYNIISELVTLEKPETLNTLTDYYKAKNTSNNAKLAILEKFLELKNPAAPTTYFDLLENYQPQRIIGTSFNVFYSLSDTIPLFVRNDAFFAKLAATDNYRDKLASLYSYNVLGDSIYENKMPLLSSVFLKNMYSDAVKYIDTTVRNNNSNINYSLIQSYVKIAKQSDGENSEINKTLQLLIQNIEKEEWLYIQVLMAAIHLNLEIDSNILNTALEDLYSRHELMESLIASQKTNLIPQKYLEPKEFAKLSLYNTAGGEYEEYPTTFNYLDEIIVDKLAYYVFTFSYYEDNEESYLGVVEKAEVNLSSFNLANAYVAWELVEEDWKTQAITIIKNNTSAEGSVTE
ncbi:TraB/GumN family protein [Aequorivita sp. Q41]|uniref:TraB/GumN family protein n=1 Tax=Aequorivita sp. Q41 TaxID=3153300 RepID=UPI003242C0FF